MTLFKNTLWFALLTAVLLAFSTHAKAQEQTTTQPQSLRIAVIDMKAIRKNSTAMNSIREQIGEYRAGFQGEIQKEEEELRKANQELSRQRSILSPAAFAEERKKFETRLSQVQRNVQKRRKELDLLRDTAMLEVQKVLNKIIATIAEENGLGIVLRRDNTVLAARSLEITEPVIKRLNKQLSSVTVPKPSN